MEQNIDHQNEVLKERAAHQAVLLDIQTILATKPGRNFVKYLFENFEVGELPQIGLPDDFLRDKLGFLRAGNSVYKIVAEANPEMAGTILGIIEKEKNVQAEYDHSRQGN